MHHIFKLGLQPTQPLHGNVSRLYYFSAKNLLWPFFFAERSAIVGSLNHQPVLSGEDYLLRKRKCLPFPLPTFSTIPSFNGLIVTYTGSSISSASPTTSLVSLGNVRLLCGPKPPRAPSFPPSNVKSEKTWGSGVGSVALSDQTGVLILTHCGIITIKFIPKHILRHWIVTNC